MTTGFGPSAEAGEGAQRARSARSDNLADPTPRSVGYGTGVRSDSD